MKKAEVILLTEHNLVIYKLGTDIKTFDPHERDLEYYRFPEGSQIENIEAEVISTNLVNIKIYFKPLMSGVKIPSEEITYSGGFLIEWTE